MEIEISTFKDRDQKVQKTKEIEKELQEVIIQIKTLKKNENVYIEDLKEKLEETKELKQVIEINREVLIRKAIMHESSHRETEKNYENSKEILIPLAVYKELSEVANGSLFRYITIENCVVC